jgi:hypothetical protein
MRTAPQVLRTRDRAVTPTDFEFLTEQVPGVGLARCWPGQDGKVDLRVLPSEPDLTGAYLDDYVETLKKATYVDNTWGNLDVKALEKHFSIEPISNSIVEYLEPRLLLPLSRNDISILPPKLCFVAIKLKMKPTPGQKIDKMVTEVQNLLCRWFHPLQGNFINANMSRGWKCGDAVSVGQIYAALSGYVDYIIQIDLFRGEGGQMRPVQAGWFKTANNEIFAPAFSEITPEHVA